MLRYKSILKSLLITCCIGIAGISCSESILDESLYSQIGDGNLSEQEGARLLTDGIYGYVQYFSYFGGNNWPMNVSSNSDDFSVAGVEHLTQAGEVLKTS